MIEQQIKNKARALGFDDCRITTAQPPKSAPRLQDWLVAGHHGEMAYLERNAGKRLDPLKILPNIKSVVTLAINYFSGETSTSDGDNAKGKGVVARYARYQDYHEVLKPLLQQLSEYIVTLGGTGTKSLWYVDTGPILERDLAQRSGLGFVGKHTNLISRSFGNWIFLAEILTTLELSPDPPEQNHCGSCARCIPACPTAAITAPFVLDARRCISYLTIELKGPIPVELRPLIGNRIYGCDDCLAVCPWNRFAKKAGLLAQHARPDLKTLNLVELLHLDETRFKEKFRNTPILRTKRRGLLRNVCVALGNTGTREGLPDLHIATNDAEELIASHAAWAIVEIEAREAGRKRASAIPQDSVAAIPRE